MKILRLEEVTSMADLAWHLTPEQEAEALRLSRESFTAADLQKFTEEEEGILFGEFLADLDQQQKAVDEGKRDEQ